MPIPIACPDCDARLKVPDDAAGKTIRCPKCTARMEVPDREVADEPADDDDRPRRRDRDRDDANDRPRKKTRRKPARSGGVPGWAWAAGGLGLAAVVGVAAWLAVGDKKGDGDKPGGAGAGVQGAAAERASGRAAPAGFTAVVEPDGGYEVFLPGEVGKTSHGDAGGDIPRTDTAGWYSFNDMGELEVGVVARKLRRSPAGTTEAALMDILEEFEHPPKPAAGTDRRRMTALGGQPALEYRLNQDRLGKPDERFVYVVTVKGGKAYTIKSKTRSGKDPDARHDTIVESFRFR